MHAITVTVNGQPPAVVSTGTRISDLLPSVNGDGFPVLGAIANNMVLPLFMPLVADATLAPLTLQNPHGWDIYRTSLCFLLAKTAHELYPGLECRVRNSVGAGLYCTVQWPDLSPAAFAEFDRRDRGVGEPPWGQQVDACMRLADRTYTRDGAISELYQKLDAYLDELRGMLL